MKKKDQETEEAQHRQIVSRPDEEHLFQFLAELFFISANDAEPGKVKSGTDCFPERIVLRTAFNVGGREDVGPIIHAEEWKPTQAQILKTEQIVALANRLLEKAQRDCSTAGRRMKYTVQAFSHAKGADAYARHLLALKPGGRELPMVPEGDDDEIGGVLSTKLLLGLLDSERRDKRYVMELATNVISGAMERDAVRIEQMEQIVDGTWKKQTEYMQAAQAMLDHAAEREQKAAWSQWKRERIDYAIDKALTMAQAIVPQLAAAGAPTSGPSNPVAKFFAGISQQQGDLAFGTIDRDGRASGGIFSPEQFAQLMTIANSPTPDDSLVLGFAASVTSDQIAQAREVFGLVQLQPLAAFLQARQQAAQAAAGAASEPAPNGSAVQ